ncbi:STAS domain-containing protein [Planobispora longispora]|uniref:STAS domain-containing protein n=1 Tax=Planobispora longispora TaxID=28887 RepID=UPI00194559BE|nr:STAS domain-containing protein [Planobispora longispora]
MRRERQAVRLRGDIDLVNAAEIADRLVAEVEAGAWHLDLSEVDYCGVAGLRALLAACDALRARGGTLRLTCSPSVLRALEICELNRAGLELVAADPAGGEEAGW